MDLVLEVGGLGGGGTESMVVHPRFHRTPHLSVGEEVWRVVVDVLGLPLNGNRSHFHLENDFGPWFE